MPRTSHTAQGERLSPELRGPTVAHRRHLPPPSPPLGPRGLAAPLDREALLAADALGPIARQALGYKEVADWLEGTVESLEEAVDLLKRRTRHFARHQLTWFRRFDIDWVDVSPDDATGDVAERVAARLFPG